MTQFITLWLENPVICLFKSVSNGICRDPLSCALLDSKQRLPRNLTRTLVGRWSSWVIKMHCKNELLKQSMTSPELSWAKPVMQCSRVYLKFKWFNQNDPPCLYLNYRCQMQQWKCFNTEVTLDTEIHIIKKRVKDLTQVLPPRSSGLALKIYLAIGRVFSAVGELFGEHGVMSLCMEMLELWGGVIRIWKNGNWTIERGKMNYFWWDHLWELSPTQ